MFTTRQVYKNVTGSYIIEYKVIEWVRYLKDKEGREKERERERERKRERQTGRERERERETDRARCHKKMKDNMRSIK